MAIGGFNGSDPSPTLAQFKAWVAAGKIHYFIARRQGGLGGGGGGRAAAAGRQRRPRRSPQLGRVHLHRQDRRRRHRLRPDQLLKGSPDRAVPDRRGGRRQGLPRQWRHIDCHYGRAA